MHSHISAVFAIPKKTQTKHMYVIFHRFWPPAGGGVQRTMFFDSENTLGTKWPQEPPKGPQGSPRPQKSLPQRRFSSILCRLLASFFWICSSASLAASQESQDQNKKKFTIVAPSFQSIRVHLSQAEYPEPPNTVEQQNR
jgi:hypothetical protein